MIVKNEAEVIRRCLDSVRPVIDRWVIVDTGSTDGTQDIVREHLRDLPGELHERPWRDFAYNRTEALQLASGKCDYTLIIDADDELRIADKALPLLSADSYMIKINDSSVAYQRQQLLRSALPWRYEGVLHEYATCDDASAPSTLFQIEIRRNHDGARRKDPETYQRDAAVLEAALSSETNPFLLARYRFYLAQSYRDCNEPERSLEHYLARAELGFWQEEVFISLYYAAQLMEQLSYPEQDVIDTYLRAADALPTRAEGLYGASRFCRQRARYEEGYQIAKRGLSITLPPDALFVEPTVYQFGMLDEFALNAYWSSHNWESLDASLRILTTPKLPAADIPRVIANAQFALGRLPKESNLGSLGSESLVARHTLEAPRRLGSRLIGPPRVLITILAGQKKECLPMFLECIEALDYAKSSISIGIRSETETDRNDGLLREWKDRVDGLYAGVEFEGDDTEPDDHRKGGRNVSLSRTLDHECAFCLAIDTDNFVRPSTLRELVALDLPIVAPLLRAIDPGNFYSNFHAEVTPNGYYQDCAPYYWILNQHVRGVLEMPVVKCTYLVRSDVINDLTYDDTTNRHEYVVFSESARKHGIPQYLDNRQLYGYIATGTSEELRDSGDLERAGRLIAGQP